MRARRLHPVIAREGWPHLGATAVAALLVTGWAGWYWSAPLWLAALFVLQFFRDPARVAPGDARTVVAPADGRVIAVGSARDPYLERDAIRVSIFMNVFNVHSNRSPVDGEVKRSWYYAGSFLNAALDKASSENERNALWLRTTTGEDITCVQVAGLIARRIHCYVKKGDSVVRGQRYGFIRFGSRVDLYLPRDARVKSALGDKVHGASTVLATLNT